jgi:benzoylformate decarboxylase
MTAGLPSPRSGSDVLLDVLLDEGITRVFGNPGTTELPLIAAMNRRTDIGYVLALHEGTAVAMADGYAQAASGFGNGMGQLVNARANHSPLVVTAGQQDRRHLIREPMLSGDLVAMARPLSKWAAEVASLDDLPTMLRRAIHDARSHPMGPVFLSLPLDVMEEIGEPRDPGRSTYDERPLGGSLPELAAILTACAPEEIAIVLDDEVASSKAVPGAVELAEALGAAVFGAPAHGRTVFPTSHALWRGALGVSQAAIARSLRPFRVALFIGEKPFLTLHYTPDEAVPDGVEFLQISPSPTGVGQYQKTRLSVVGDLARTLGALVPLVRSRADSRAVADALAVAASRRAKEAGHFDRIAGERAERRPCHPMGAVWAALAAMPADSFVVDEAVTAGPYVRGLHSTGHDRYFSSRGGGLGWAMPAAVGVSLATGAPVLCVVGDGAAMYAVQALWTAAHERVPVVFVVLKNREYLILKRFLRDQKMVGDEATPVLDLTDPEVDYVGLAQAMGVPAVQVTSASELGAEVKRGWGAAGPRLIEIIVG